MKECAKMILTEPPSLTPHLNPPLGRGEEILKSSLMQQDSVSEIKSKLDILTVVGEKVQLKKAGRIWKGLCPWHKEKTPSFTVSPDKEMCYCFGCHRGGDIFSFTQLTDNVDFKEAMEMLAEKAGVKLRKENPQVASLKQKMFLANNLVNEWWQFQLWKTDGGAETRKYLERRGVSDEAGKHFGLGWAPDSFEAGKNYLTGQDLGEDLLLQSGLLKRKDGGEKVYDLFRGRLMFPVKNRAGKVIAFSGRVLDDSLPKYVNSPETVLWRKQDELFHFSDAKKEMVEKDFALVVEGNVDVVASWEAGVQNVVAPLGTALTGNQLGAILKLTQNLVLAFDADPAGQKAARKSVEMALGMGFGVKMVGLEKGSDPDDVVRKDGKEKWQKMVKNAVAWFDFFAEKMKKEVGVKTPQEKKKVAEELLGLIKLVESEIESEALLEDLAKVVGANVEVLRREMGRVVAPDVEMKRHPNLGKNKKEVEDYFWGMMEAWSELGENVEVGKIKWEGKVAKRIAEMWQKGQNGEAKNWKDGLEREELEWLAGNEYFVAEKFGEMNEGKLKEEMEGLVEKLMKVGKKESRAEILKQIEEAKREGDEEMEGELLQKLSESLRG